MKSKFLKKLLFFAVVLFGAYAFCHMPAYGATLDGTSGTLSETVSWTFDSDTGVLTLSATAYNSATPNYSSSGHSPFYACTNIKHISVDTQITTLGAYLFDSCTSLESCCFNKVSTINDYCFVECTSLKYVHDGSLSVPAIATTAFSRSFYPDDATWFIFGFSMDNLYTVPTFSSVITRVFGILKKREHFMKKIDI